MTEFKIGDVVVLNSGGPRMVICTVPTICVGDTHARASCAWIAPSGKAQGANFKLACLRYPTPQDEWEGRKAGDGPAGRLPVYANRTQEPAQTIVCQDCKTNPSRPASYGTRHLAGITRSGGRLEVVDWMHLCGPCARARGFSVPG